MKTLECDKFNVNTININDCSKRKLVKEIHKSINLDNEVVQVILQFPNESQDTAMICDSIKEILMMELKNQIKDIISIY